MNIEILIRKYIDRADRVSKKNPDDAVFYLNAASRLMKLL
jgi:hypothetical protein